LSKASLEAWSMVIKCEPWTEPPRQAFCTIGDAIESFTTEPDGTAEGMCLVSR